MSMSEIDRSRLFNSMANRLSSNELQDLFSVLNVDYENLPGSSRTAKSRELIAYMDRMGRMPELLYAIDKKRPDIFIANAATTPTTLTTPTTSTPGVEAASLNIELASLRQQLVELQKGSLTDEHIENRIKEILRTADRAVGQSEELNAKLLLPPSELTDVPLVPVHLLNRLEEHRSDESAAFLLIGAFAGAVLGILSNWATNENFTITRFSIVLMIFMLVLTSACIFWVRVIRRRADALKKQMLSRKDVLAEQTNQPTVRKVQ